MDLDSVAAKRLREAFPPSIVADVDAVLQLVEPGEHAPSDHDVGPVLVDGASIHIPYRIYVPEPKDGALDLSTRARTVMGCLYTRHHDGYVREKYLQAVISSPLEWVPPFVIQLVGEYVIEIQQAIWRNISFLRQTTYAKFVAENRAFIALTRQRVASYWDCYFRDTSRKRADHAGWQIMDVIDPPRTAPNG